VVPSGLLFDPWRRGVPVSDGSRSYYYFGVDLPQLWSTRGPLLAHVDAVLVNALTSAGYGELSYYAVPEGFALVTRMEQINPDGTPSTERWPSDGREPQFSIAHFIRQLLYAPPGLYRVVVFIVSPAAFTPSPETVSGAQAQGWVSGGANVLPRPLSLKRYSSDHTCTALIYEFERADDPAKSRVNHPGRLTSDAHLERSGIQRAMAALAKGN
jgi:hypothetical protein